MLWTDSFKHRVLFNASKAYAQQLGKGRIYQGLQPVYALGLVNENFEPDSPHYYHHYQLVHQAHSHKKIDGLELVFIELPKFKAQSISERKLQVLWLRYLTEIKDQTENISPDLMQVPEIREAIEFLEVSSFSKTELLAYDKYWDSVSSERTLIADAEEKGEMRGQQQLLEIIRLHTQGKTVAEIALAVGKSEHEVQALLAQAGLA